MRRSSALVLALLCTVALSGCVASGGFEADPVPVTIPPAAVLPPAAQIGTGGETVLRERADPAWVAAVSDETDIPIRALEAYAGVALLLAEEEPSCRVDWATLAGIGAIESRHGTIDGGELQEDGRATEPIFGPLLDGGDFDAVADHDGGALDGNAQYDRAMGPMQIIPATWMAWHAGGSDVQNIDDATLGAARYLCHSGGDLGTETGWRDAIRAYNPAASYADAVAQAASIAAAADDRA